MPKNSNIFWVEFNDFFVAATHLLDYGAMKCLGTEVPILME